MIKKYMTMLVLCIFTLSSTALFALTLESSAFFNQEKIPVIYTCDGKGVSPPLSWKNAPAKTTSYVLTLSDPDAPGGTFYHWVLFNIPASITSFKEGINPLPEGSIAGTTSWGKAQYNGPCPPKGTSHHYIFSLYALNTTLALDSNATAADVLNALQNHVMGEADLKVTFARA